MSTERHEATRPRALTARSLRSSVAEEGMVPVFSGCLLGVVGPAGPFDTRDLLGAPAAFGGLYRVFTARPSRRAFGRGVHAGSVAAGGSPVSRMRSKAAWSSTGTPSDSALASLEPAASPATT